jgi:hypothetical protein
MSTREVLDALDEARAGARGDGHSAGYTKGFNDGRTLGRREVSQALWKCAIIGGAIAAAADVAHRLSH